MLETSNATRQATIKAGRRMRLPRSRRFIDDFLSFSIRVPSQSLARQCNLAPLVEARANATVRISWPVLFMKAFSLVADKHPGLRRVYMRWPWPHLYEHPHSIGRIAIAREFEGEDWLFFSRIIRPEEMSLTDMAQELTDARHTPVRDIPAFLFRTRFVRLPTTLRRMIWWLALNLSGTARASLAGTVGLSTVSNLGALSIHPPSVGNIVITYGPIAENGDVRISMVYDHRVLDGGPVAQYLGDLEETLNGQIRDELLAIRAAGNRAA